MNIAGLGDKSESPSGQKPRVLWKRMERNLEVRPTTPGSALHVWECEYMCACVRAWVCVCVCVTSGGVCRQNPHNFLWENLGNPTGEPQEGQVRVKGCVEEDQWWASGEKETPSWTPWREKGREVGGWQSHWRKNMLKEARVPYCLSQKEVEPAILLAPRTFQPPGSPQPASPCCFPLRPFSVNAAFLCSVFSKCNEPLHYGFLL